MPKSQTLSTAAEPKDIDKAYASASKALNVLGIKVATKKPDADKLGAAMTKAKKKAEFKLNSGSDGVTVTVECAGYDAELGELDIDAVKDPEKRAVVLESLVAAKLMTQGEMDKIMATMKTGPDPKIAMNELRKKIEALKAEQRVYDKTTTYAAAEKNAAYLKELQAFATKQHTVESIMFIGAVEKKFARDKIMTFFINDGSKFQVNISASVRAPLLAGGGDFSAAVHEIKLLVQSDVMTRMNGARSTELGKDIKALEKELSKLEG